MEKLCYHNIYVPIENMNEKFKIFYYGYYNYLLRCMEKSNVSKNNSYKLQPEFKDLITKLNDSYNSIRDLKNLKKNEYGEYPYPKAAFKKKDEKLFICLNGTDMRIPIDLSTALLYTALYYNGNLKSIPNKNTYCLVLESDLNQAYKNFKTKAKNYEKLKMLNQLEALLVLFGKYPKNSISIINYKDIFTKKDLVEFINNLAMDKDL